jgi:hypothetical protein
MFSFSERDVDLLNGRKMVSHIRERMLDLLGRTLHELARVGARRTVVLMAAMGMAIVMPSMLRGDQSASQNDRA